MKTRNILISLGVAAALAGGAYSLTASAHDMGFGGWGMMGGYGPGSGMMGGYGPGPGMMGGYGPGYGHMYGPGRGPGQGYGPGSHMRGWGGGYGPGMMGWDRGRDAQGKLNLTTDDVKGRMERWLARHGNPRLKLGEVKEKDADTITADVVTQDNSLVERFIVDRHTGLTRRDNS